MFFLILLLFGLVQFINDFTRELKYINNEIVYYFEVYMDGAIAYIPVAVDSEGFADNNVFASMPGFEAFAGYYVEPGFYMFEVDEYGVYTLTKVAETAKVAQKIVELSKYDIRNGKLTVNGAKGCDNIDISGLKVVDESGAVTAADVIALCRYLAGL